MTNILNYNEWTRKGRGLRFEFCSSDDDISSLIRKNFFDESEFQLYIIAGYFVKNANEYIPKSCKILPEDIPKFKQNGVWNFLSELRRSLLALNLSLEMINILG